MATRTLQETVVMLMLDGVTRQFGGVTALENVSFTIDRGKIIGLIGPNGAGKTTLFNLISGLYPPTSGHMSFNGTNLLGMPAHRIARLGIARTFQHIRLFEDMSLRENVVVGMHARLDYSFPALLTRSAGFRHQEKRAFSEAEHLLEKVGLGNSAAFKAGELSYGDQRRLEIARALASQPQLLLLDEPVAGMNGTEKNILRELVQSFRHDNLSVLLIEHDMTFVMGLCDQVIVLNFGRMMAMGTPQDIKNDPGVIEAYIGTEEDIS